MIVPIDDFCVTEDNEEEYFDQQMERFSNYSKQQQTTHKKKIRMSGLRFQNGMLFNRHDTTIISRQPNNDSQLESVGDFSSDYRFAINEGASVSDSFDDSFDQEGAGDAGIRPKGGNGVKKATQRINSSMFFKNDNMQQLGEYSPVNTSAQIIQQRGNQYGRHSRQQSALNLTIGGDARILVAQPSPIGFGPQQ